MKQRSEGVGREKRGRRERREGGEREEREARGLGGFRGFRSTGLEGFRTRGDTGRGDTSYIFSGGGIQGTQDDTEAGCSLSPVGFRTTRVNGGEGGDKNHGLWESV